MRDNKVASTKPRENYVDIIKGFAIIAVVLLHIQYNFHSSSILDTSALLGGQWHVAVFFLVSGFFIKEEKMVHPLDFMKLKFKNLYLKALWVYIPFVLLHNFFLRNGWLFSNIEYNHGVIHEYSLIDCVKHIVAQFLFFWREPFCGAMWYVDSLLFAFGVYSIIVYAISKFSISDRSKDNIIGVIIILLSTISIILSNKLGMTIPKCSNVFTGLLLIFVGKRLYKRMEGENSFANPWYLIISCLLLYQYNVLVGSMALASNICHDVVYLIVVSVSALYILAYIGKKIQFSYFGKTIAYIGKESFWIMGWHMIGFHVFTSLYYGTHAPSHFTTPLVDNVFVLLLYLFFGIVCPLTIISTSRKIGSLIFNRKINII